MPVRKAQGGRIMRKSVPALLAAASIVAAVSAALADPQFSMREPGWITVPIEGGTKYLCATDACPDQGMLLLYTDGMEKNAEAQIRQKGFDAMTFVLNRTRDSGVKGWSFSDAHRVLTDDYAAIYAVGRANDMAMVLMLIAQDDHAYLLNSFAMTEQDAKDDLVGLLGSADLRRPR